MKTLYFDCFAGASGNMILGGLISLGVDRDELVAELKKLRVADFSVEAGTVDRSGIAATHLEVKAPDERKHRHLHHIESIIDESDLGDSTKFRSKAIFRRLAEAEAKVHGIDIQKVHFHEVGAIDAIVDVVGACIGFDILGIERFVCSKIHLGSGFVTMEHGKYPVPPPAVANLLEGVPAYATEITGELITPTGAAIITTLCSEYGPMPEMTIERTGYGAGTREYENFPNVLRLMVGTSEPEKLAVGVAHKGLTTEKLVVLETNIDDMSAQVVGFVSERALDLGALDCWVTPVQMKKNRPGATISILCSEGIRPSILELLFTETTTLGIRSTAIERISLPREIHSVETMYGRIDVKIAVYDGSVVNVMPEYEQVRSAAVEHGMPFRQVHAEALAAYKGIARSAVS
ncbi:MAG: nickel pincer cofactor biosynthesis protein LarC [Pyrinomonadaceae bacterium]